MNQKIRKTALLMGACSLLGVYSPVMAANPANPDASVEAVQQTTKKVTGTVSDSQGPVIGASVVEKGTTNGVVTDFDGNFSLNVKPGATLVISYIGYTTQEVATGNQANFNITLKEDNALLEEVVVVGYGVQKKKLVTGATVQVKGEDIAKLNTTNALTAMQASSPGVNITQSSSQPGKGFKVNIRGVGTIGESSPLLIIDGINAGTADNGLNGLNPNDIESIDVLKDAASAAIYGARAANGVILVTTKQGKAGKLSIQYDGYVGWSNAYKVPGLVDAKQYMQLISETNFNVFGTATDWSTKVPQYILDKVNNGWSGTDWFKEYENKNALQFSHAVTLSGGSERSKFSMGLNYSSNEGIMGGDNASNYKRFGARINSEHILLKGKDLIGEDHDIITLGENVSFWYHRSHDLAESNGYWNIMQAAYVASPLVEAWDADGNLTSYATHSSGYDANIYSQPLNHFINGGYNSINKNRDFGVGGTFYWIIEPIKNLRYRGQFNIGYSSNNSRNISKPFSQSSTSSSANYSLNMSENQSSSFTLENTLSYALPQLGKHNIDVLVGQSIERSNWSNGMLMSFTVSEDNLNSMVLNGWDYNIPSNYEGQYMTGHTGYDNPWQGSIASFFGRINWNYDEKYMLTAILRTDGSSNFARGKRWGTFPSVSAGWVITNEPFMAKTSKWLDFLKIRASWGQNGNCAINNFYYLSNIGFSPTGYSDYGYKFSSDMIYTVGQNNYAKGAYAKNVPNEDVTWETSAKQNYGVDLGFFKNELTMTAELFYEDRKDILTTLATNPIHMAIQGQDVYNIGRVKNHGFELEAEYRHTIPGSKNTSFWIGGAYSFARNKVIEDGSIQDPDNPQLWTRNRSTGLSWIYVADGFYSTQEEILQGPVPATNLTLGDVRMVDINGDGIIDGKDTRPTMYPEIPEIIYSSKLGFSTHGFSLNVLFQGGAHSTKLVTEWFKRFNLNYPEYEAWTPETKDVATRPRVSVNNSNSYNLANSTLWTRDGSYLKLRNVELSYVFPKTLLKQMKIDVLRVYVNGQNLYSWDHMIYVDPEMRTNGASGNYGYPQLRVFNLGANITF